MLHGFSRSLRARIASTNEPSRQAWLDRHRHQLWEVYRSVGGYPGSMHGMPEYCDAMRSEMKPGDVLLVEQASGPGMTVR